MTYGVYTRDLHYMSVSDLHSIAECKQYLWGDGSYVVCSEKRVWCSFSIMFTFHKWRGFRCSRLDSCKVLGFVTIEKKNNYYTWADQIVYDPKKRRRREVKARAVYTVAEQVGEDKWVQKYKSKVIELPDDFLKPDGEGYWHFMCFADIGKVEEEEGKK